MSSCKHVDESSVPLLRSQLSYGFMLKREEREKFFKWIQFLDMTRQKKQSKQDEDPLRSQSMRKLQNFILDFESFDLI